MQSYINTLSPALPRQNNGKEKEEYRDKQRDIKELWETKIQH